MRRPRMSDEQTWRTLQGERGSSISSVCDGQKRASGQG